MAKRYNQATPSPKTDKKRFSIRAVELVLCIALAVVMVGAVIGKYLHKFDSNGSVRAKDFYFTSDFLDGKTHTLAPGATELSFTIGNHADELRFSEMEIKYKVTVTNADGTAANGVTIGNATGTLAENVMSDATVTISGLMAGKYTITAVGEGGYTKTLTAKIEIPVPEQNIYYHIDSSTGDYILLTVWNDGDVDSSVTIKYTGIPDNTNPNMTDWADGSTAPITKSGIPIAAHESKVFCFFSGTVEVPGVTPGTPA